jgi:CheY-like chemotaxis protein
MNAPANSNSDPGTKSSQPITILLADDDEDDRELIRDAIPDEHLAAEMKFVTDGQDLLDYLRRQGAYANASVRAPRPKIILLDLNMPRMDGLEALAVISADDSLRRIPVLALTTSNDPDDIRRTYELGASSFITKPASFAGLTAAMRTFAEYWLDLVELPNGAF